MFKLWYHATRHWSSFCTLLRYDQGCLIIKTFTFGVSFVKSHSTWWSTYSTKLFAVWLLVHQVKSDRNHIDFRWLLVCRFSPASRLSGSCCFSSLFLTWLSLLFLKNFLFPWPWVWSSLSDLPRLCVWSSLGDLKKMFNFTFCINLGPTTYSW